MIPADNITTAAERQKEALEAERRQLWISVAVAVARAENAKDLKGPGRWADQALADFDWQFRS